MRFLKRRFAIATVTMLSAAIVSCGKSGVGSTTASGNTATGNTAAQTKSLAVADSGNNRILIYSAPFSTDESATVVLGQVDFIQHLYDQGGAPAANTLSGPGGLAKDSAGNLYVADAGNCRILQFRTPFTTNMNASLVIGQSEFNSPVSCYASPVASASGMDTPTSVAVDSTGNLWVTDVNFSRVTEYEQPLSNGMAATLAIGQPDLNTTYQCNGKNFGKGDTVPPATASTLCAPSGAVVDSNGNLWVADSMNQRVLEFVPPFSTGMAASLELGQPMATAFTSNTSNNGGVSSRSLSSPTAVSFDAAGNLWVVDTINDRVLEFIPPFASDMAASLVIGAPDFTTPGGAEQ